MKPEPRPIPIPLSRDLLEAEEARTVLNMPQAKFELLLSSGQLPIFRSNGKTCFRREDIAALALKRQANAAKSLSKSGPATRSKTPPSLPAVKPPVKQPLAEQIVEEREQFEEDCQPVANSNKRKWFPWLVGAAALAAVVIAVFTFLGSSAQNSEPVTGKSTVSSSTFTKCKAAPGLVEALSGERPLSFEVAGKLRTIFVDEGQTIKIGDPIAELENADLAAKLKSSQADLSAADASLGLLKGNLESDLKKAESEVARLSAEVVLLEPRPEDIEQARADAAAAEADAKRMSEDEQKYSDPHGRGTSWSVQLYDQSRRLSEAAAAKFASAKSRLHALEAGSRPEEKDRTRAMLASAEAELRRQKATSSFSMKSAEAQVERARAQVDLAKAELEKTRVTSTINGTVVRKYMHPGEVIDALHPQPVVTIADLSQLRVRADVDETDFPCIQIGQKVKITADAFEEGKFLTGTVENISHATGQKRFSTGEAKEKMDVRIIETIVRFDAPPASKLKLGLRVTAYFALPSQN